MVVEADYETNSDENRTVLECEDSADVDEYTELGDMEVEDGYERFLGCREDEDH